MSAGDGEGFHPQGHKYETVNIVAAALSVNADCVPPVEQHFRLVHLA